MVQRKLIEKFVEDSTIKLIKLELITRVIQVAIDSEKPEDGTKDVDQELITVHSKDENGKQISHRQVLDTLLDTHALDIDTVTIAELKEAALSDLIVAKYE